MPSARKRSLTGIQPSGNVHLGNYLGMLKPAIEAQGAYECFYFLADLHTLTTVKDGQFIKEKTYDAVAAWLACGFDVKQDVLFRQSDVPLVTELAWYLSCCTGVGFLEKAHAYKDALAKNKEANHGTFAYPVLMAADILLYDIDIVPVGKDQKQHVEMARDMAGSFNAAFGADVLKLPEVRVKEDVMTIPGLDGRKMSKSYGNEIALFCEEKELRKKVLSIKTDSTGLDDPKELKGTLLGELFALFAKAGQYKDLEQRLAKGGVGWGHAKEELFEVINEEVKEPRQRYLELRKDEGLLDKMLHESANRAFTVAGPVLERVRHAVGFRSYPYNLK